MDNASLVTKWVYCEFDVWLVVLRIIPYKDHRYSLSICRKAES